MRRMHNSSFQSREKHPARLSYSVCTKKGEEGALIPRDGAVDGLQLLESNHRDREAQKGRSALIGENLRTISPLPFDDSGFSSYNFDDICPKGEHSCVQTLWQKSVG